VLTVSILCSSKSGYLSFITCEGQNLRHTLYMAHHFIVWLQTASSSVNYAGGR